MPLTVPQGQDSMKPRSILALAVISCPLKTHGFSSYYESGTKPATEVSGINGLSLQETQILVEKTAIYPISCSTI